jgi:hypothetical protein
MNQEELHSRFGELGFELPHSTVKRLSRQKLLAKPRMVMSRGPGGGRGRSSDWPEETVAQAAAIYAIREQYYHGQKKRLSLKTVKTVQRFANTFFVQLEEYRNNTDDPDLGDFRNQFYGEVDLQEPSNFVVEGEGANDTLPKRSWRLAFFNETYEALAVKWITAHERAMLGIPLTTPVTIRYYFGPQSDTPANEGGADRGSPLCYLFAVAMRSNIDRVHVTASPSDLEKLPQLAAEDDAFLGAKIEGEGWIRVSDPPSHLVELISSFIPHPQTEAGEI